MKKKLLITIVLSSLFLSACSSKNSVPIPTQTIIKALS
jgi:uncharacterized protein YcfL